MFSTTIFAQLLGIFITFTSESMYDGWPSFRGTNNS